MNAYTIRNHTRRTAAALLLISAGLVGRSPVVVGGIIGGLIGNQFGSGRGRTATTIAGAALGASVGANHSRKRSRERSGVQRCEVTEHYREYERIAGYRVTYRYDGKTYTTETKEHPGTHLKLELSAASS